MSIPSYQTFMLPMLEMAADNQEHALKDMYILLSEQFKLTEAEKEERLASGRQRVFHNRIGWACTYLKKAGLLSSVRRGAFIITDRGQKLLAKRPAEINTKTLEKFPEFVEFFNSASATKAKQQEFIEASHFTPTENFDNAFNTIKDEFKGELLDTICGSSPRFFEQLVVDLLLKMGYGGFQEGAGFTTPYTNDGGIDGIINEDPLGLNTVYIQAKRYKRGNSIGRPDLQAFAGALEMRKSNKGVFITTSFFNDNAIDCVKQLNKHIILINGEQLADLMIKHSLGVSLKQSYEIMQIDSDYFPDTESKALE